MNTTPLLKRILAMTAAAALLGGASLTQTSCYYDDYGYRGGPPAPRVHYSKVKPKYKSGGHRQLKPKEKARLGYGRHAGHPHGGPPGQRKKYWR